MENIKQEPDSTPSATNTDGTKTERRRKRRWGSAAAPETATSSATTATILTAATTTSTTTTSSAGPVDSKAKALALKASIAARLAALKSRTAAATAFVPTSNVNVNSNSNSNSNSSKRPLPQSTAAASSARASSAAPGPPSTKRAKHYELDMTVTGPTFAKAASLLPAKPKPKANPYLAHREAQSDDTATATADNTQTVTFSDASSKYVDARLEAAGHTTGQQHRQRHRRELRFVEPGTFVDIAERKRQRAANAASAGFASGRKAGQYFRSATMGSNYYGTTEVLDEMEDKGIMSPRAEIGNVDVSKRGKQQQQQQQQQPLRAMPTVVEWWDMELLPSKLRRQVASYEGKALSKATQSHMQLRQPAAMAAAAVAVKTENDGAGTQSAAAIAAATTTTTTTIETETEPKTVDRALELRTKCSQQASLSHSKTAGLVQHIVPIQPPGDTGKKPSEPVLYLTKKEQKRARKRRREQKQRELQDLQAAGLIEPPEPRLTLQNFIRVMGDQAYVDPSQMEQKVMEQVQKRQRAHLERNEAKKLSREQKAEKLRNKVLRDANPTANATGAIHVALFFVKNASHPYHRTKIDLNAQQLNITGGVVECDFPSLACVVCEGGPKAIQKYTRLMMVRMKWKGPDGEEEDDDEIESDDNDQDNDNDNPVLGPDGLPLPNKKPKKHRFDRDNHCALVWTGMVPKRQFAGFVFQHCETSAQARKVLGSRGVGQYWNQVLAHASGSGETMRLKLVDSDDDDDDNEKDENDNDNDNEKDDDQDDNHADADAMDVDVDVDVEPTEA